MLLPQTIQLRCIYRLATFILPFHKEAIQREVYFQFQNATGTIAANTASKFISRLLRAGIELLEALKNATLLTNGGSSYTERTFRIISYLGG